MPDFITDFLAKKAREDAEYTAAWQKAVDKLSIFLAKKAREDAEYAAAWQKAVDKLSITFVADRPLGGFPHVLVSAVIAEERLRVLRDLGFRVLERWEMDDADPGDPPNLVPWVRISGDISVNLGSGFVVRRREVRGR